jgi:hypothetical protein
MKDTLSLMLAVLLTCCVAPGAFAADQDEATLKAMEQAWISAATSSDSFTIHQLLDDSFVEQWSNGTRTKADVLLAPPPPAGSTQTLSAMTAQVNGDNAVVTGINQFKPSPTAEAVNFSFTDTFVRRPEGWRITSSQMTRK